MVIDSNTYAFLHSLSRFAARAVLGIVAMGGLAGCGNSNFETAKVEGTVTLDGVPMTKGTVSFIPDVGRGGYGIISPEGAFRVSTYGDGDGAVLGTHRVTVTTPIDENSNPEEIRRNRVPPKYASPSSSGFVFAIESGKVNQVDLKLKTNP